MFKFDRKQQNSVKELSFNKNNLIKKKQLLSSVSKYMEKKESLCTVGGNINWYSHQGKQYRGSSKN